MVTAPGAYFVNSRMGEFQFFGRTSGVACRYLLVVIIVDGVCTIVAGHFFTGTRDTQPLSVVVGFINPEVWPS